MLVLIGVRDPYSASISQNVISGFIGEFNKGTGLYRVKIALAYVERQLGDQQDLLNYVKNYMYGLVSPVNTMYGEVKPESTCYEGESPGLVRNRSYWNDLPNSRFL